MNLNLLKSNLKTLILTIIIFVILGFLVFLINKLLFKEYVCTSKFIYITGDPDKTLTKEEFNDFKAALNDTTLISNVISEVESKFDISFTENDYKNSISVSKKTDYILVKSKANNPRLAEMIIDHTNTYIVALSQKPYFQIETTSKETIPLKNAIITSTIIGSFIGLFIIITKNKNKQEDLNDF